MYIYIGPGQKLQPTPTSAFPSRAVTSGSDVRVWELADRKQKTRVAAPAGNNSSNVEHKLCIEFL